MIAEVIQSLGRFDPAFRDAAGCQPRKAGEFRVEIADQLPVFRTYLADYAKKQKEDATQTKPCGQPPMAKHAVFHGHPRYTGISVLDR